MELTPFRIARWHERYEFTTELMLSSSAVSLGTTSETGGLPGLGFPRLRAADTQTFCERLAAEAGVLLVPGEVYDVPGQVRLGLGRLGAGEAFRVAPAFRGRD